MSEVFEGDTIETQTIQVEVETMKLRLDAPDEFVFIRKQMGQGSVSQILTPAEARYVRDCLNRIFPT